MDNWMKKYEYAKEYYLKNGNLNVPKFYKTEDGFNLYHWLVSQRKSYKNRCVSKLNKTNGYKPLTDEQVRLLESIGIAWNRYESNWLEKFKEAKKYYKKYGNLDVKYDYITESGIRLSDWLKTQRQAYKNRTLSPNEKDNNYSPLTDKQVNLLESIGMNWDLGNKDFSRTWIKMYNEAKKYYLKNGNLMMGTYYKTENGYNLGAWIHHQRQAYKNRFINESDRKNSLLLTDEQVNMLESIGIVWDAQEYEFVHKKMTKKKKSSLEKRFLEFLSDYIKENKNEFENIEDVKNIEKQFIKTLGNKENHYSR